MAWPFTSVGAPNLDTGTGADVPTTSTLITGSADDPAWPIGAHFSNHSGGDITVSVTDGAGGQVYGPQTLPDGAEQPVEWPFRPVTGLKWAADAAGLKGHLWGYV